LLLARTRKENVLYCETSIDSGSHHLPGRDVETTIPFENIKADDKVLIRTRNSEYQFSVIDPLTHKGMLSGGGLGVQAKEAYLIESLDRGESGSLQDFRGLKTGARALFYLSSGQTVERVTTSKISSLTLVKAVDRNSLIS
jgi:hypothetical protein